MLVAAPTASAVPPTGTADLTVPITGTGPGATFEGTFTLQRFVNVNGRLFAQGTLTGTLTNTVTGEVRNITEQVLLPVTGAGAGGTCQILHLELGPIDLNLLGLRITTNKIVIDITAERGPGNLLGNLLCGLANALNGGGGGLANLLNRLLGLV